MQKNQKIAVFAGSFDPLTWGHLYIIEQAAKIVDKLHILIGEHNEKNALFTKKQREQIIRIAKKNVENKQKCQIEIQIFKGLLIENMKKIGATIQFRGLRNSKDYEYEMQMLEVNERLYPQLDTFFIVAPSKHRHISASLVRQVALMKGDVDNLVPPNVAEMIAKMNCIDANQEKK